MNADWRDFGTFAPENGRRKCKWFSYVGNTHLSILLRPNCILQEANQLSFVTSISIGDTLKKIKKSINVKYKWPNDIILNNKKVGGVIIETSSHVNKKIQWIIIGIGVNIIKYPYLKNNKLKATSLVNEKIHVNNDYFINLFLKVFFENFFLWKKNGFNFVKKKWILNLYKKNNNIVIKYKNKYVKGKLLNLLFNGGVQLKINNKIKEVFFGDQVI